MTNAQKYTATLGHLESAEAARSFLLGTLPRVLPTAPRLVRRGALLVREQVPMSPHACGQLIGVLAAKLADLSNDENVAERRRASRKDLGELREMTGVAERLSKMARCWAERFAHERARLPNGNTISDEHLVVIRELRQLPDPVVALPIPASATFMALAKALDRFARALPGAALKAAQPIRERSKPDRDLAVFLVGNRLDRVKPKQLAALDCIGSDRYPGSANMAAARVRFWERRLAAARRVASRLLQLP